MMSDQTIENLHLSGVIQAGLLKGSLNLGEIKLVKQSLYALVADLFGKMSDDFKRNALARHLNPPPDA